MNPSQRPVARSSRGFLWVFCSLGCLVAVIGGGVSTGSFQAATLLACIAGSWLLLAAHAFPPPEDRS